MCYLKKKVSIRTNWPQCSGICIFVNPRDQAFLTNSTGYSPVSSWYAAAGAISSLANFLASSLNSLWVSSSSIKKIRVHVNFKNKSDILLFHLTELLKRY